MGSTRLEDMVPDARERARALINRAAREGIKTTVVSTLRSCAEQRSIYAQGRTVPGTIISGADGCKSWHVWGRAVDLLVVDDDGRQVTNAWDERYDRLGVIGESLGMVWGGKFSWGRDAGHFEYHPEVAIQQVCPDPDNCEAAIQLPWPGPVNPPPEVPTPPDGGEIDLSFTTDQQTSRSMLLPVVATLAALGAAGLWWKLLYRKGRTA